MEKEKNYTSTTTQRQILAQVRSTMRQNIFKTQLSYIKDPERIKSIGVRGVNTAEQRGFQKAFCSEQRWTLWVWLWPRFVKRLFG